MSKKSNNWDYQWGQVVGRAWADDDFNQRLRADPAGVLKEYDLPPPAGLRIEVLEDTDRVPEDTDGVMYLVLPGKPSAAELSEEELCNVGGAVAAARCGCHGCHSCGGCGGCGAARPVCGASSCFGPTRPDQIRNSPTALRRQNGVDVNGTSSASEGVPETDRFVGGRHVACRGASHLIYMWRTAHEDG